MQKSARIWNVIATSCIGSIALILLTAADCEVHPVTIHYYQVHNSDNYDPGNGSAPIKSGNVVYVLFTIANPSDGKTFDFQPRRLYYRDRNMGAWSQPWWSSSLPKCAVPSTSVAPGDTVPSSIKLWLGCVVVPIESPVGNYHYYLTYDSSIDNDSVFLIQDNSVDPILNDTLTPAILAMLGGE